MSRLLLLLLPAAAFACMFLAWGRRRDAGAGWQLLLAALTWLLTLWASTELLSLGRLLSRGPVALAWLLAAGAALLIRRGDRNATGEARAASPPPARPGTVALLPAACALLVLLPALVTAACAPPNNADLVEYHLPRVMHWVQNRSVAHYPTHIERQLRFGPLMEYAILHAYLLWGDDRVVNPLGWLATAAAVAAAALLAGELGAGSAGRGLAAVLAASAPMTVLQASSGKNDPLLAFCLLAFACAACRFRRRPGAVPALAAGAAMGLALLVKGTAYIFAPPLAAWAALAVRGQARGRLHLAPAAVLLALALNLGFWRRNCETFGDWLGNAQRDRGEFGAELHTPASLISGVTRNLCLHLMNNYNPALNPPLAAAVRRLHGWLGLSSCDPRTTFTPFFCAAFSWTHWDESESGNAFLVALALLLVPAAFWMLARGRGRPWCSLLLAVAAGFVLFSFLLKFQRLHVRLHQPLCFLAAACIGAALGGEKGTPRRNALLAALALVLTALAVPAHLYNRSRPLVGTRSVLTLDRKRAFVTGSYADLTPCLRAAAVLRARGCRDIGLVCDPDEDEYFLWAALFARGPRPFRFEHVCVRNASRKHARRFGLDRFLPQAVIYTRHDETRTLEIRGQRYLPVFRSRGIRVLVREDHVHPPVVRLHRQ